MKRVVIVTRDVVGERMAGPGIRALHLSEELSRHFDVTLVASGDLADQSEFTVAEFGSREASEAAKRADLLFGQPIRGLRARSGQRVVYDLFAPVFLELEHVRKGMGVRMLIHRLMDQLRLRRALRVGDLLVAATPAQNRLYAGLARKWGLDVPVERWVTVPFGVENTDPPAVERRDDELFLWNGGVWPWLDEQTAIAAIASLRARGSDVRLLFLGAGRPGEEIALRSASGAVATEGVEWNSDWVPYRDRHRWIGRARGIVMLHHHSEEALYSIRTRFFDALWCGVPVVATRGGWVAELVEEHSLGVVVAPGDVAGVAEAIETLRTDDDFHRAAVARLGELREEFRWKRVAEPLVTAMNGLF